MNTITKPSDRNLFDVAPDVKSALKTQDLVKTGKSSAAFRTISEVADELGVQQHVLRFWETKFSQVKPLKRGGGRRYYRPEDVQLLRSIHRLLYTEGYTIKGVQKLLRDVGKKHIIGEFAEPSQQEYVSPLGLPLAGKSPETRVEAPKAGGMNLEQRAALMAVLEELKELRGMIKPVKA